MKQAQILFDPVAHRYTDTEGNVYTSVTTYIDEFKPKFDKEYWAAYQAVDQSYGTFGIRPDPVRREVWCKRSSTDPGRWYNMLEIRTGVLPLAKDPSNFLYDWKKMTDEACARGNVEHEYLEDCINEFFSWKVEHNSKTVRELDAFSYSISDIQTLEQSPMKQSHPSVYETLRDLIKAGYTIYAEKRVYSWEHLISGTIDVLAVNDKGEFWIVDWKTNKDKLMFESGYFRKVWDKGRTKKVKTNEWVKKDDRMFAPLEDLQLCKGMSYTLQLSLYARLCELWGLKCKGLILCHLRIEDKGNGNIVKHEPIFYTIQYLPQHIDRILKLRERTPVQQPEPKPLPKNKSLRKQLKY